MALSENTKLCICCVVILLSFAAFIAALSYSGPNDIACAKCGESDHKFNRLVLHVVTKDNKELAIPYCPKCCVEVLDTPALTWAGNQ